MPAIPPPRTAAVPEGRTRRLLHLGRAIGELAAGAAGAGLVQLAQGKRPDPSQWLLTAGNAQRLANRLSTMRGAVMKLGQLMSMDGQGVLPAAFAERLADLRDQAHRMTDGQLTGVLLREYGPQWGKRFRHFDWSPIATASIGQVHRAQTLDGQPLALKIQYPGVRDSIDSDVANLALLARMPGLIPPHLDPTAIFERIREQLHHETDYRAEARALTRYRMRLGSDPILTVPAVHPEHSTARILATDYAPGIAVDHLAQASHPQARRDQAATALARLAVRELFEMRLVQTDPNFANYRVDIATGRIALLDFGATETVRVERVAQLRELGRAVREGDAQRTANAALKAGFIDPADAPAQTAGVIEMLLMAGEPLRHVGPYDFGASDLFSRGYEQGRAQFFGAGFARTPPPDLLFLQRKFVGTFMLCARLKARVDLADVFSGAL